MEFWGLRVAGYQSEERGNTAAEHMLHMQKAVGPFGLQVANDLEATGSK